MRHHLAPVGFVVLLNMANAAGAATRSTLPNEPVATASYYKKSVYDPTDAKIGEINDVLVDTTGKVTGLVVGVGVFLGVSNASRGQLVPVSGRRGGVNVDAHGAPSGKANFQALPVRGSASPCGNQDHEASASIEQRHQKAVLTRNKRLGGGLLLRLGRKVLIHA
jgi:sporulation protein YlmC with PRC-barrel domain